MSPATRINPPPCSLTQFIRNLAPLDRDPRPIRIERHDHVVIEQFGGRLGEFDQEPLRLLAHLADRRGRNRLQPNIDVDRRMPIEHRVQETVIAHRAAGDDEHVHLAIDDVDRLAAFVVVLAQFANAGRRPHANEELNAAGDRRRLTKTDFDRSAVFPHVNLAASRSPSAAFFRLLPAATSNSTVAVFPAIP